MRAPESTSHERYPVLDGIRGFAVLFVLTSHISNRDKLVFLGGGQFGVWLFFVLSSFLLSLYFFQKPERMLRPIEWSNYAFRRFMRIYPLYIAALLAGAAAGFWSLWAIVPPLLPQEPTYWAIFVEFRFYFLLPAVVAAFELLGRRSRWLPPLATVGAAALHCYTFPVGRTVPGYEPWGRISILFWEYLIVFVIGSFAAWAYVHTPHWRTRLETSRTAGTALVVITVAPLLAMPQALRLIWPDLPLDYFHLQWMPWSVFFAIMIYLAMMTRGVGARFFRSQPMRFFGFISYSLYLFMDVVLYGVLRLMRGIDDPVTYTWLAFAGSTLLAWLLFTLAERPLSRLSLLHFQRARHSVPEGDETGGVGRKAA